MSLPPISSLTRGDSANGTSPTAPQDIASVFSPIGLDLIRAAIFGRLGDVRREMGVVDMEIVGTVAELTEAEVQLRELQQRVERCKESIPTLQAKRKALGDEESILKADLAILPQAPSAGASDMNYTVIDGFTFAASSLPPPPVSPKRPRPPEEEVNEPPQKRGKPDFELLQECFPVGTTVYHKGQQATIEGFTGANFLIKMGNKTLEVDAQALVYVPKEEEICLVKSSPKGAECKYYFAKVIKIEKPPEIGSVRVRLTIEWVGSKRQETREVRVLDRLIPLGPENPILRTLKTRVESDEEDLSKKRIAYYLTRRSIEVPVSTV